MMCRDWFNLGVVDGAMNPSTLHEDYLRKLSYFHFPQNFYYYCSKISFCPQSQKCNTHRNKRQTWPISSTSNHLGP